MPAISSWPLALFGRPTSAGVSAKPRARNVVFRSVVAHRESPLRVFAIRVLKTARCFDILTLRSPSVTVIRSCKTSVRSVRKFLVPFGRPLEFPEQPFLNRLCTGGFPKPTSPSFPIFPSPSIRCDSILLEFLLCALDLFVCEAAAGCGMAWLFSRKLLVPLYSFIDVPRVEFHHGFSFSGLL